MRGLGRDGSQAADSCGVTTTVAELSDLIAKGDPTLSHRQGTIVVDADGLLAGIITRGDIMKSLLDRSAASKPVSEAAATDVVVTYPEETLQAAAGKMFRRDIGRLPVVEGPGSRKVVGYLGRADILRARVRLHEAEETRERGPVAPTGKPLLGFRRP